MADLERLPADGSPVATLDTQMVRHSCGCHEGAVGALIGLLVAVAANLAGVVSADLAVPLVVALFLAGAVAGKGYGMRQPA